MTVLIKNGNGYLNEINCWRSLQGN